MEIGATPHRSIFELAWQNMQQEAVIARIVKFRGRDVVFVIIDDPYE